MSGIVIRNAEDRALLKRIIDDVKVGTEVRMGPPQRTVEQNAKMWAMLTDVAEQYEHNGRYYHPKQWKLLMLVAFGKEIEFIPTLLHASLGISGEGGEIVDAVKKNWVYEKPLDRENLIEEIGDLLFYTQALCSLIGIELVDAVDANMAKLNKRYPQGYTDAAAIARADKAGEAKEVV